MIYRLPKQKFHNYAFTKGVDDDPVEYYKELTYGRIESQNDLIYLSFYHKTNRPQREESETNVVLDIKQDEHGKTNIQHLHYHLPDKWPPL